MSLRRIFAYSVIFRSVLAEVELKDDYLDVLKDVFSPVTGAGLPRAFVYDDGASEEESRRLKKQPQAWFPSYYTPDPAFVEDPVVPVFNWAKIAGWEKCGGQNQSPIEINASATAKGNVNFRGQYEKVGASIANNKHNVGASFAKDPGSLSYDGNKYDLKQFHFHSPSEHRLVVDGVNVYTPLEMHMVHTDAEGGYAVVSIMFEVDDAKAKTDGGYKFLQQIESAVGVMYNGHNKVSVAGDLDFTDLKINDSSFFYYVGSLTTPPCTEGVNWFILSEPRYITTDMHKTFANGIGIAGGNNRPLNPLNGRRVAYVQKSEPKKKQKGGSSA